jgi:hypothetical protein
MMKTWKRYYSKANEKWQQPNRILLRLTTTIKRRQSFKR